jgi:UDP-N-acetylglucosamine/UDP-N-acetylgalactosamine diphosphorylase
MAAVPDDIRSRLRKCDQEHVLDWAEELNEEQAEDLLRQLVALDLEHLEDLFSQRDKPYSLPRPDEIQPVPVIRLGEDAITATARKLGEEALHRGEAAVLVVAGGQGTRLGFEHPKGMYPVGPISEKSLFQIHTEKVRALGKRYGKPVPFLIMTSHATDAETRAYFREHDYFGADAQHVHFFRQGTMPALDLASGKLLMEAKHRLFTSPNGHGGTLTALREHGLLDRLRAHGIKQLFYFQVDNPLVHVAEPAFLGQHLETRAEVSIKIIAKEAPTDKLGNLVMVRGRCHIIEYSDLPEELARQREESGRLLFWAGSPAIHIFDLDFLARVTRDRSAMPFHIARKKVRHLDAEGRPVYPERENALKFEMFIFDAVPLAERWTVVETTRRDEFAPLKNASGPDSPETARQGICNQVGDWLEKAGVLVPWDARRNVAVPLEISPLFALDAEELKGKVNRSMRLDGPLYFG